MKQVTSQLGFLTVHALCRVMLGATLAQGQQPAGVVPLNITVQGRSIDGRGLQALARVIEPQLFHEHTGQTVDMLLCTNGQHTTFASTVDCAGSRSILTGQTQDATHAEVTFSEGDLADNTTSSANTDNIAGLSPNASTTAVKDYATSVFPGVANDAEKYASAQPGQIAVFAPTNAASAKLPVATPTSLTHDSGSTVTPLVFDGVTVIDVKHGRRLAGQRVVIVGTRITKMGRMADIRLPHGARVIDARGKYLLPGLWDMHTHPANATDFFYPLFLVNGITGIRDAGSPVPLATQRRWRQEILAGTRVGPPRQILSGPQLDNTIPDRSQAIAAPDVASARRIVDSLKAAGADMIKMYNLNHTIYFAIAAEARRVHIPFGGHLGQPGVSPDAIVQAMAQALGLPGSSSNIAGDTGSSAGQQGWRGSAREASDSGASILDHTNMSGDLNQLCWGAQASVAHCQPIAAKFQRNGTWAAPTLIVRISLQVAAAESGASLLDRDQFTPTSLLLFKHLRHADSVFRTSGQLPHHWLHIGDPNTTSTQTGAPPAATGAAGLLNIVHQVGLPLLAGSDVADKSLVSGDKSLVNGLMNLIPGISLQTELALEVAEGQTPLEALQAATLNPARLLHATDSLGTVAPGKIADLVLLDADPLTDITNTTEIRAVVANGRYFDRSALDQLLCIAWNAPHAFWRQQ